ncbi:MAG: signal recognition particle protein [Kiritimatiellaeota bacterium]|nr:signal recognition particle protein [Kiritimatiellota bacterium]
MFDKLTASLQQVFKHLRGYGQLTTGNIQDALREVRRALLEADVNYQVARDFIARVQARCVGADVLASVTPGQQVIKRVHDELVALLGGTRKDFDLNGQPAKVLLLGLNGAGKTTTAGKLARQWQQQGRRVLLAACDLKRPAAVAQLRILAGQVGADFLGPERDEEVAAFGRRAAAHAAQAGCQVAIFDSAGRLQVDRDLMQELQELKVALAPQNSVLVVDAAIGQESVNVAATFHRALGLTGLILTKLDGDARGGAALSVQQVTQCPILRVGVGERLGDLEPFYPDRMASRILGMGDVVSLVEKAQAAVEGAALARAEEQLRKQKLTLEDFLEQMQQMKKLGPLGNLLELLPGAGRLPAGVRAQALAGSEQEIKRAEAIIRSMTVPERRHPELLDASRKRRIARGSGTEVQAVNELLGNFNRTKKMMQQFGQTQKRLRRLGK